MTGRTTLHRFVSIADVADWLALGWMPHATFEGTIHGFWSVHVEWLCGCRPVEPVCARGHRRREAPPHPGPLPGGERGCAVPAAREVAG